MIRTTIPALLGALLSLGCGHHAEDVPVPPVQLGPSETKTGAPVELAVRTAGDRSVVTATFARAGVDVELQVWGATGLEVNGDPLRWSGDVRAGQAIVVEVTHAGGGDLAVRAVGTFLDQRIDAVRSWTLGTRAPTVVPRSGDAKGWDATRR